MAKKPKRQSRADRWARACTAAAAALRDLVAIQEEYSDWKGNLPENLSDSPVGQKLETVCDIDLQGALDSVEEAETADLPLGFGRD